MSNFTADIRIEGLRKSFGGQDVLRDVNLEVPAGSIFGFLGLNGAGKTTLIRILLGLLQPDAGRCAVAGIDPQVQPIEVRRRIGYMAENQTMYSWMRVKELIEWVARFYPAWDATSAEDLRKQMRLDPDQKAAWPSCWRSRIDQSWSFSMIQRWLSIPSPGAICCAT